MPGLKPAKSLVAELFDFLRFQAVAGAGQLAAALLHVHDPADPVGDVGGFQGNPNLAVDQHDLVGWRRRYMDAGAEIGHQQELGNPLVRVYAQRHDVAGQLDVLAIKLGDSTIVVAGGQESMSNSPHYMNIRKGIKMGDGKLKDSMIIDGLWDVYNQYHMGITAENVAEKFQIRREEQDSFAAASQRKAAEAIKEKKFVNEIVPVKIKFKKEEIEFDKDEYPKAESTVEKLAKLRPAFKKDGTVTAGNASGVNDGAAAVCLMTGEMVKKKDIEPLAKIVSWAQYGVDPSIMGTGPIPASKLALKKAGWGEDELDLIESNEAFAAQAIAVNKEIGWIVDKVNVNGGAIALGHPIGASGARILVTLIHEMQKRKAQKGLATLCVGGGMGIAMCIERNFLHHQ